LLVDAKISAPFTSNPFNVAPSSVVLGQKTIGSHKRSVKEKLDETILFSVLKPNVIAFTSILLFCPQGKAP
jgi:hypothetical protein